MHEAEEKQLKEQLIAVTEKYEKKLEKERNQFNTRLMFLNHQIELKDDRITKLLDSYQELHNQFMDLVNRLLKFE